MEKKPKIAITLGDPSGVGPEIAAVAAADEETRRICEPVIFGSPDVFGKACELVGADAGGIEVAETGDMSFDDLAIGEVSKDSGTEALASVREAVESVLSGSADAVVTAPVHKKAIRLAGSVHPGHTEMLREMTGAENAVMMFEGGDLRVALVTIHCALSEVAGLITADAVFNTVKVCSDGLSERFGIESPRIAVCGLNPHAGDGGEFGSEDIERIAPAVMRASAEGLDVSGPLPADAVFHSAMEGRWDLVVAMYHDQGLAPFKMLAFHMGVNVTLGLPIVRTSPDHGTAFDIAWRGVANPRSMKEAVKTAVRLVT